MTTPSTLSPLKKIRYCDQTTPVPMHDVRYLLVHVRKTVLLRPEEQPQHVRLQVRPPQLSPNAVSDALDKLFGRGTTREVQPRFLIPLVRGMVMEDVLSAKPLVHLNRFCCVCGGGCVAWVEFWGKIMFVSEESSSNGI